MLNIFSRHMAGVLSFAALLFALSIQPVAAEFQIGVEGGFHSSSVDHSYDFNRSGFSTGVSCGSIKEIEDGIGNPVGIYGQYTKKGGEGWGVRYGHYSAGDSTIQDLSLMYKNFRENKAALVAGIGVSELTVDVKRSFGLTGLCDGIGRNITFPAQEIDFGGFKFLLGLEKQISKKLAWTLTGSYALYNSASIDTKDGFETTIEPSIFSLTTGLTILF